MSDRRILRSLLGTSFPRMVWAGMVAGAVALSPGSVRATWSIVIVDTKTKEVAIGSATCLSNFDLKAGLPMVLVDVGGAAAQSLVDAGAVNRAFIREQMLQGRFPDRIITLISQSDPQFESRQFGIADTRGLVETFTGFSVGQFRSGVIGVAGDLVYAIQGNVLTGAPVIGMAEQALVDTPGDIPEKLMAAMEAARAMGGDGRCSCSPTNPTSCGSPPSFFEKSAHIGFMLLTRTGDTDGVCNGTVGCANGDYFMDFNVAFQGEEAPDPVFQLGEAFDSWRAANVSRPDAVQSIVSKPEAFLADAGGKTTLTIQLRDWQGNGLAGKLPLVTVEHDPGSAGMSEIGEVTLVGDDMLSVELVAPPRAGVDVFRITADDFIRPVVLLPLPRLHVYAMTDADRDDDVDVEDSASVVGCVGGPGAAVGEGCVDRDADDDGDVDLREIALHQNEFTAPPCVELFIHTHPESQQVPCGLSFTLFVDADFDPQPRYQWYHNGEPIAGATDFFYQVAVATATDLGEYYVRLANPCGVVFSNTAVLTPRGDCP